VPVDGVVLEGASLVDESWLTGESTPVARGPGDAVLAGTRNGHGSFVLRVDKVADDTALAAIVRRVEEAHAHKAPVQRLADRVAAWFVPAVLLVSAVTFVGWARLAPEPGLGTALRQAIAVLVVACPCALGLATPTAVLVGITRAAERGVLVRGGRALEALQRVTTVVFDKTGTLTAGTPEVVEVIARDGDVDGLLRLAAAVERASEHPLAAAVVARAAALGLQLPPVEAVEAHPGGGVEARVGGAAVALGSARWLRDRGVAPDALDALVDRAEAVARQGATPVLVAVDGVARGLLAIADPPRADAADAVAALRSSGLDVWILSGDLPAVADAVGRAVGVEPARVLGGLRPDEKVERIAALRAGGAVVAMVGDGVNDAPALASADVGIALGTGTDVAVAASDVTLVGARLGGVVEALGLSRRTMRIVRQNLAWAFGYNAVLIPLATGVLQPVLGVRLSPLACAVAMSLSSVTVVLNALRLRHDGWAELVEHALASLGRLDGAYVPEADARTQR
jgi:Cu+-exporting ATPase